MEHKYLNEVPVGLVIMWYGNPNELPEGWHICDYNYSSRKLNLSERFIVGADPSDENRGTDYSLHQTGGASQVTLSQSQMPKHSHNSSAGSLENAGNHSHSLSENAESYRTFNNKELRHGILSSYRYREFFSPRYSSDTYNGGLHSHSISVSLKSSGGSDAHNNIPPYRAVYYIVRVAI